MCISASCSTCGCLTRSIIGIQRWSFMLHCLQKTCWLGNAFIFWRMASGGVCRTDCSGNRMPVNDRVSHTVTWKRLRIWFPKAVFLGGSAGRFCACRLSMKSFCVVSIWNQMSAASFFAAPLFDGYRIAVICDEYVNKWWIPYEQIYWMQSCVPPETGTRTSHIMERL